MSDASVAQLAAPSVDGAVDGVVVLNGSPGLTVRVEPYPRMTRGDEVQLRWDTGVLRTSHIDRRVVGADEVGRSTLFTIDRSTPGTIRVSYLVGHPGAGWRSSPALTLTIRR
ncbi:hypothetical protein GCM10020221_03780 [Streptomyces thioluteus]|uniref:Uncharacterized protein n=1 Tax=Streptomyces thioluteus TaxID=66431 RepID=A0ABN3WDE6_STRTU